MKFDYAAVDGALTQISSALETINEAINDKIVNTTYESGNAKDAVEGYIASLNSCLDPVATQVGEMKAKIQEVRDIYFESESNINSALGANGGGAESNATNNSQTSSRFSTNAMN